MPIVVLGILVQAVVMVVAWWRIFTRIGWPPMMAILMAIPFVSLAVIVYLAFTPSWPIEQRHESLQHDLKRLRGEL